MIKSENSRACGVIILAAGLGKRMRSTLPKVLHEIGGKPLIYHVLNRVREVLPQAPIAIVVGHGSEKVKEFVDHEAQFSGMKISFVEQPKQRGTGDAAACAMEAQWGKERIQEKVPLLILPGDQPLVSAPLIEQMTAPLKATEALRLLTTELADPFGYGRVIRRGKGGPVIRIVEERDAIPKQKEIREVATSTYFIKSDFLKRALQKISNHNAQGEYYLTDVIGQASQLKKRMSVLCWKSSEDLRGVNDPWELASANQWLNERLVRHWSLQGVRFFDPRSTWLDVTVRLEEGAVVHPGAILTGSTHVKRGATIGPRAVLKNVEVGENADVKTGTVGELSRIGAAAIVGPYAHLRPGSVVGARSKIGNFVELKKTKIGENSSIAHLSYLGDAEVGNDVNIGCGFVTCNYDGRMIDGQRKHRTVIEDGVFLGSDCQTIAPVRVGKGAYVASGSTITDDVEPGAMAIARSRQVNKAGYASKLKMRREEE